MAIQSSLEYWITCGPRVSDLSGWFVVVAVMSDITSDCGPKPLWSRGSDYRFHAMAPKAYARCEYLEQEAEFEIENVVIACQTCEADVRDAYAGMDGVWQYCVHEMSCRACLGTFRDILGTFYGISTDLLGPSGTF